MSKFESDAHIFNRPMYRAGNGLWCASYADAVKNSGRDLSWDASAILSMLSSNFVCGNRTLLNEIKRKPWLSSIQEDGTVQLLDIPPHDTVFKNNDVIAAEFFQLLREEVVLACENRDEVYILLSGGMDSRIVAAIAAEAARNGAIKSKITAVTWGLSNSRDVYYAKSVAGILGLDWTHIDLSPDDVIRNLHLSSSKLGCLVSGLHLHKMSWFQSVDKNALVLAGSYGDSIGRAEYSGKHLLDLRFISPVNRYGLINKEAYSYAMCGLKEDLKELRDRGAGKPQYVLCDYEMQGHYMRGMINQAMSVINDYCSVYQVFTSPKVYSYMWSIHPSLRTDDVYARMLETLNPQLARLPWARTNKALSGKTVGARDDLGRKYHRYEDWVGGDLFDQLMSLLDMEVIKNSGVFSMQNVQKLCDDVKNHTTDSAKYNHFVWLVGLCQFSRLLADSGKLISAAAPSGQDGPVPSSQGAPVNKTNPLIDYIKEVGRRHRYYGKLVSAYNKLRKNRVIKDGFKKYPIKIV